MLTSALCSAVVQQARPKCERKNASDTYISMGCGAKWLLDPAGALELHVWLGTAYLPHVREVSHAEQLSQVVSSHLSRIILMNPGLVVPNAWLL